MLNLLRTFRQIVRALVTLANYRVIRNCTFNKRYWKEGAKASFPFGTIPPHHFECTDVDEEPENFTEEELRGKKFNALKKIAKEKGIETDGINNSNDLVALIMGA